MNELDCLPTCAICYDDLYSQPIATFDNQCGHVAHLSCLQTCIARRLECPMCRKPCSAVFQLFIPTSSNDEDVVKAKLEVESLSKQLDDLNRMNQAYQNEIDRLNLQITNVNADIERKTTEIKQLSAAKHLALKETQELKTAYATKFTQRNLGSGAEEFVRLQKQPSDVLAGTIIKLKDTLSKRKNTILQLKKSLEWHKVNADESMKLLNSLQFSGARSEVVSPAETNVKEEEVISTSLDPTVLDDDYMARVDDVISTVGKEISTKHSDTSLDRKRRVGDDRTRTVKKSRPKNPGMVLPDSFKQPTLFSKNNNYDDVIQID
ncbi:hypothetical protein GEMRC1_003188 [Eukaryota sp. GEM-RC1]